MALSIEIGYGNASHEEATMDVVVFERWLSGIAMLTLPQRRLAWQTLALSENSDSIHDIGTCAASGAGVPSGGVDIAAPPDEPASAILSPAAAPSNRDGANVVAALGQRRVDSIGCPHCNSRHVVHWGQASALPRYRCKGCQRTFNALTKTPLAHLRMKDKWVVQANAMIDGVSVLKAAQRCDVDYKTAFRWRHRFLASLAGDKPAVLSGIVEGDETFILESFTGKRSDMPPAARKRGGKSAKRGLSAEQIPVIVARDRHGATTDAVLPKLNRVSIAAALGGVVTPANEFCCDGGTAIVAFARRAGIPTHILPMPGKPNPQAPDFHINNVNAYHSRLKEWLRRFHGVATKNLANYLGWRRTLEALGQQAMPDDLILGAIGLGPYQQTTG
jgi:transposase-like protein